MLSKCRYQVKQECDPEVVERGLCFKKYMSHTFELTHFCIYDNNLRGTAVYAKVLKDGQIQHRAEAAFFY